MQKNTFKKIHFVGVGGAGMSAIAWVLLSRGYTISGSDLCANRLTARLAAQGAKMSIGHAEQNIKGADLVVVTSAVSPENQELQAAHRMGIPVWRRGRMLAELMHQGRSVAVAGTHGKTTTTSMVGFLLEQGGLDPTVLIGGEVHDYEGNARVGESDLVVAEADESDGSLLEMRPDFAVVTNVEWDHLDYYRDWDAVVEVFGKFLRQLRPGGKAILCCEDLGVQRLIPALEVPWISYGVNSEGMDLRAEIVEAGENGSRFRCLYQGENLGELRLSVPGLHNVYNSIAATGVALSLGVDFSVIQEAFPNYKGVMRRFQRKGCEGGVTVIDDYAHHPTEVLATLQTADVAFGKNSGRIICVFQPHRFSRTQQLGALFGESFSRADMVVVTDVYGAGEKPIDGVSGEIIYRGLLKNGHPHAHYVASLHQVPAFLMNEIKSGDTVLTMGAGDIWKVGESILNELKNH